MMGWDDINGKKKKEEYQPPQQAVQVRYWPRIQRIQGLVQLQRNRSFCGPELTGC